MFQVFLVFPVTIQYVFSCCYSNAAFLLSLLLLCFHPGVLSVTRGSQGCKPYVLISHLSLTPILPGALAPLLRLNNLFCDSCVSEEECLFTLMDWIFSRNRLEPAGDVRCPIKINAQALTTPLGLALLANRS